MCSVESVPATKSPSKIIEKRVYYIVGIQYTYIQDDSPMCTHPNFSFYNEFIQILIFEIVKYIPTYLLKYHFSNS